MSGNSLKWGYEMKNKHIYDFHILVGSAGKIKIDDVMAGTVYVLYGMY